MTTKGKKVCDRCGHPAAFYDRMQQLEICEVCVHANYGEREGERYATAQMLAAAVQMSLDLGMTKPEVGALVAEALDHESRHESLDLSSTTLYEERREGRGWLRRLTPIGEVA